MKKRILLLTMFVGIISTGIVFAQKLSGVKVTPNTGLKMQFQQKLANTPSPYVTGQPINKAPMQWDKEVNDGDVNAYAFLAYEWGRFKTKGFIHFTTADVNDMTMIKDYTYNEGTWCLTAGTMVGDEYWGVMGKQYNMGSTVLNYGFGKVDMKTGESTLVYDYYSPTQEMLQLSDMTYDPKTDKMYAVGPASINIFGGAEMEKGSILYEVPYKGDGVPVKIWEYNDYVYCIAADNGMLYALGVNANVTDPQNPTQEEIDRMVKGRLHKATFDADGDLEDEILGNVGAEIAMAQTMEFDHSTHTLYWAGQAYTPNGSSSIKPGWLVKLDTETGAMVGNKQIQQNDAQIIALAIPYQIANDGAPSYVKNLTAVAADKGVQSITLNWTMPTVDFQNRALTEIKGVKIYRDDQLVHDTQSATATTWTESDVPSATHTYKVLAYNTAGDGLYKEKVRFVGRDKPGKVINLTLTTEGNKGTLTWQAPVTGKENGWFDNTSLKYDITRMPDNKVVATDLQANTYTDEAQQWLGYSYIVTAKNSDGTGASETSNMASFGLNESVPFVSSLSTEEDFNKMIFIDANHDGTTWTMHEGVAEYMYCAGSANDYIITPPLAMDATKKYQVRYEFMVSNWVTVNQENLIEKLEVLHGTAASPEKLTNIIATNEMESDQGLIWHKYSYEFTPSQTGINHVAWRCCSKPDQGYIRLRNVSVREISETDLSVTNFNGSTIINQDTPTAFNVTVKNEGTKAQGNYTVEVFNTEDNTILGTANGKNVEPKQETNISVNCTAKKDGKIKIAARVILDGDTYPYDNISSPMEVEVQPSGSDLWISIGERDNGGYNTIWTQKSYCMSQTLYYKEELLKDKATLTALELDYSDDVDFNGCENIPVEVYLSNTKVSDMYDHANNIGTFLPENEFKLVYKGEISMPAAKAEEVTALHIDFDTPFEYTGENLGMKIVRVEGEPSENQPNWHRFTDDNPAHTNRMSWYYPNNWGVDVFTSYEDLPSGLVPCIRLAYSIAEGIDGVMQLGTPTIKINDGELLFNTNCQNITLSNIDGRIIRAAKNASSIKTIGLPKGVYIVTVEAANKVSSTKVSIK